MPPDPATYIANVATDAERIARDGDALANALAGGAADETVSVRVAQDARRHAWARWGCAALSLLVQPDHCAAVRRPDPLPGWVYARAAVCFAVLAVAAHPTSRFVCWWGAAMALNAAAGMAMLLKKKR